jgi:hypothetical protein
MYIESAPLREAICEWASAILDLVLAPEMVGRRNVMRIAMIAMTIRSSRSVKPLARERDIPIPSAGEDGAIPGALAIFFLGTGVGVAA